MTDETDEVGRIMQAEREAHTAKEAAQARGEPWEVLRSQHEAIGRMRGRRLSLYAIINRNEGRRI